MNNINIRQVVLSDLPYLYEICLKTGNNGEDASKLFNDPYLIGHYYIAPYIFYPKSICFVAEYEFYPKGYIAAVPDTIKYKQWLEENWLPPLRKQFLQNNNLYTEKEKNIVDLIHKRQYPMDLTYFSWLGDYPAHLHIDLLPIIQRKGVGIKLMGLIFSKLLEENISGIYLNVDLSNTGAIKFYEKLNFKIIKDQDWYYTMGKII